MRGGITALTKSLGLDCPGLEGAQGCNMALVSDESNELTELRLTLFSGDDYYTPVWQREGDHFTLGLTDFAQGKDLIDLQFTVQAMDETDTGKG